MITTMEHFLSKFELRETLGTGAFSEVKLATERATGNKYAIKIIDKAKCKGKESMIETEISILLRVQHEHIVQLYEMFAIENKIYLPENLLLSDKSANAKVMISDFGLSKILNDESAMKTACGTPGYVAPEVLRKRGYGREVDMWSIGVISYILLCGYPPFYDQNNAVLFRQIMSGKYEFDSPWWDNISKEAKDFVRTLLVLDPRQRYSAKQALAHPYIVKTCGVSIPTSSPGATGARGIRPLQNSDMFPGFLISDMIQQVGGMRLGGPTTPPQLPNMAGCKSTTFQQTPIISASANIEQFKTPVVASLVQVGLVSEARAASKEQNESGRNSVQSETTAVDSNSRPASSTIPPNHNHVRILSYNIFLRPPGIKSNSSDFKNARLNHFACNILPSYDVVCLQEIYSSGSTRMTKLLSCAKKYGFEFHIASPSKGILNASVDGGLLILSRYPIVEARKITFVKGIYGDKFTAKGAIYAKVKISPNKYIHVFNTHLQSSAKDAPVLTKDFAAASQQESSPNAGNLQVPESSIFNAPSSPLFFRKTTVAESKQLSHVAMSIEANAASVRLSQLAALKDFIDDIMRLYPHDSALLAGCLNVNSRTAPSKLGSSPGQQHQKHSDEYLTMLRLLRGELIVTGVKAGPNSMSVPCISSPIRMQVNDLMYETCCEHPVTFGETGILNEESGSADPACPTCVDYIMLMKAKEPKRATGSYDDAYHDTMEDTDDDRPSKVSKPSRGKVITKGGIVVDSSCTKVEKLLVTSEDFVQLSDHYGLATSVFVAAI
ncbi:hypothetical protein BC830DRAFT_1246971 [Chytriomyces sp. MP71]|nr:hypothetical protein BC830DRAFT_1246971 [Chytriomyces sp. MP71]